MLTARATPKIKPEPSAAREAPLHIPGATYRLQFNHNFTFRQALALVPYLKELGVTDCYASPFFKARAESLHGYDITDPSTINPEVGTEAEFRDLAVALRSEGMGIIADIVSNHMGIADPGNTWWTDVLENGPISAYAKFFDIDWRPPKRELTDKVLLPMLGNQYGWVLENKQIELVYREGAFSAGYYQTLFPIAPRTWPAILKPALGEVKEHVDASDPRVVELESILTALGHLPSRSETDSKKVEEGLREKEVVKRRLHALVSLFPELGRAIDKQIIRLNGIKGDPASFGDLEKLLGDQAYRLCHWRVAADEVNYRRFFDVSDLAAIRVELPEVFSVIHEKLMQLIRDGFIRGLRIDHVDGLYDPEGYLTELQRRCREALDQRELDNRPFFIVVEKILGRQERLRSSWPVQGTTGYDYLRLANGLYIHPSGSRLIDRSYRHFTGLSESFGLIERRSKRLIMQVSMSSEIQMLATRLDRISEQHRWSRDFTLEGLRSALREVFASFSVYRTYIRPGSRSVEAEDRLNIVTAVSEAKRLNPAMDESLFEFIGSVLLLQNPEGISEKNQALRREFVLRVQQVTGTIMAKSVEDTAFYRHYPIVSANEVGADPEHSEVLPDEFHDRNKDRIEAWPHSLITMSTHDTKRGEDARARINVLSEMPTQWHQAVSRWQRLNRQHRLLHEHAPDANEEYLLYQTLIGVWHFHETDHERRRDFVGRIQEYMTKAMREAKVHTSWIKPNEPHENAVAGFVEHVLDPGNRPFLDDFQKFHSPVARAGMLNSLSQTLMKITSPGVPDFYQGTELWDFALVDPDNRRPVDFERRIAMLASFKTFQDKDTAALADLIRTADDGRIKLYLIWKALGLRSSLPKLFSRGYYIPLRPVGERREHVVAFARTSDDKAVIALAGRFFFRLGENAWPCVGKDVWRDTAVSLGKEFKGRVFRDVLSGARIKVRAALGHSLPLAEAFAALPVALLEMIP